MLKETVKYDNFDGVEKEETLYFNLTKTEMIDMLDLQPRLEAWAKATAGTDRDLTTSEITDMIEIIKLLIEKSYGVRTEDGNHFRKSPELYANFKDSAIYDAFVFGLFMDPEHGVAFMMGILPKGIEDIAERISKANTNKTELASLPDIPVTSSETITAVDEEVPAWIREDRDPTSKELQEASPEEIKLAFKRKMAKN